MNIQLQRLNIVYTLDTLPYSCMLISSNTKMYELYFLSSVTLLILRKLWYPWSSFRTCATSNTVNYYFFQLLVVFKVVVLFIPEHYLLSSQSSESPLGHVWNVIVKVVFINLYFAFVSSLSNMKIFQNAVIQGSKYV